MRKFFVTFLGVAFIFFVIFSLEAAFKKQKSSVLSSAVTDMSLEKVFQKEHSFPTGIDSSQTVTLVTTGDVIPARSVNSKTTSQKDFTWPYSQTAQFLSHADVTLINLE